MSRGLGPGGVWGGRTPPRIRDLCSKKFFEKFSYLFGPPLDKNRSQAPEYNGMIFQSSRISELFTARFTRYFLFPFMHNFYVTYEAMFLIVNFVARIALMSMFYFLMNFWFSHMLSQKVTVTKWFVARRTWKWCFLSFMNFSIMFHQFTLRYKWFFT